MNNNQYPELLQLLGGYFGEDWPDEFETDNIALDAILKAESPDRVRRAFKEVEALLNLEMNERALSGLMWTELGCCFDPSSQGISYQEWLMRVKQKFKAP